MLTDSARGQYRWNLNLQGWDSKIHTACCVCGELRSHRKFATNLLQPKCNFLRELLVTPKSKLGPFSVILSHGTMSF